MTADNGVGTNFGVGVGEAGPEGRERGMGFFRRGELAPLHQLGGLLESCKLPQRGPGGAIWPTTDENGTYFVTWHTYPKPRALQATFAEVFVKE